MDWNSYLTRDYAQSCLSILLIVVVVVVVVVVVAAVVVVVYLQTYTKCGLAMSEKGHKVSLL